MDRSVPGLARKSAADNVVETTMRVPASTEANVPVVCATLAPLPLTKPKSRKLPGVKVATEVPSYVFEIDPTNEAPIGVAVICAGLIVSAVALAGACRNENV